MSRALPTGCSVRSDTPADLPRVSYAMTISTTDTLASSIFNSGVIRKIWCNASGTVSVAHVGNTDGTNYWFSVYTVTAGAFLEGEFYAVAGTSSTALNQGAVSSAVAIVLET